MDKDISPRPLALDAPPVRYASPPRPDDFDYRAPPQLPHCNEGFAPVSQGQLYYRDYGGSGSPLILVHPASGSSLIWDYQINDLVKAGYRVIAYSRRGHYGSSAADPDAPPHSVDLLGLLFHLKIDQCYLVASAAGCTTSLDFAMSHSDRLNGVVVSSGAYGNIIEPDYLRIRHGVGTEGLEVMPSEFREVGPSYRAANDRGLAQWIALEHKALVGEKPHNASLNAFTWATLALIDAPVLFVAGGADLAAPPTLMRHVARHVNGAEMLVIPDSGHSIYWERPDAFNEAVLEFFSRRGRSIEPVPNPFSTRT